MSCTTILVGKKASYDGSTLIARNDDSGSGHFTPKKFVVVHPKEQPRIYRSVLSHVTIDLPEKPMRYTAMPNAVKGEGIWAGCGVNEVNVAMTATETIANHPRVLGADPLVEYHAAEDQAAGSYREPSAKDIVMQKAVPPTACAGGIGEEDMVSLVLPYIYSAREGVLRLGSLLERYGTYEMNGIAFQDEDEIWWMETIGGHHWIARRVPDDVYVVMPNQLGIDFFDFEDAFGEQKEFLCSADLKEFIRKNHLDVSMDHAVFAEEGSALASEKKGWNPREVFGTHTDADHLYNTPRAWFVERYLNPHTRKWDGEHADYRPDSDDLPWCMVPERRITVEDIKYVLSAHYQGTPYDPYVTYGDRSMAGAFRSIGINRNDFLSVIQIRPEQKKEDRAIEWIAFGSNVFNVLVPFYALVDRTPEYLAATTSEVSTESFYWTSRMIAALSDASYGKSILHTERYEEYVMAKSYELLRHYDTLLQEESTEEVRRQLREQANEELAQMVKKAAADTLKKVLDERSNEMKNAYLRSDS